MLPSFLIREIILTLFLSLVLVVIVLNMSGSQFCFVTIVLPNERKNNG